MLPKLYEYRKLRTGYFCKDGHEVREGDILEYEQTKRRFLVYWHSADARWCAHFINLEEKEKNYPHTGIGDSFLDRLNMFELDRANFITTRYDSPELVAYIISYQIYKENDQ